VFGRSWQEFKNRITGAALCVVLFLALVSCSQQPNVSKMSDALKSASMALDRNMKVEEVSPPETIQKLRLVLDPYKPKVKILGPKPNTSIEDTTVTVRFDVDDFPLFKDPDLGLGPHLHVFLDDQPYQAVYDASQSLTFKDLSPGTHTIRAFASRPWHESVKTPGAFDQLTFNVFAPTQANHPDPDEPLLTYSRPEGVYGAEPILLDYYLTPSAKTKTSQSVKVRVSLNGKSFTTDEWTPIYLKGFKPGSNWVRLELLDENGKLNNNVYSETLRVIQFNPNGQDTLSKLVRGDLTAQDAERIVDLKVSQRLAAQKRETPIPVLPVAPSQQGVPSPAVIAPKPTQPIIQPTATPSPTAKPKPTLVQPTPIPSPKPLVSPSLIVKPSLETIQETRSSEKPKSETKTEPPFWSKFNPKQFLDQKPSQAMDKVQTLPVSQPTVIPIVSPLPTTSPTVTAMPKQVSVPAITKPEPSKAPEPKSNKTATRWQEFLKFQPGNTEKPLIVKPTEVPTVPSRYKTKGDYSISEVDR
jgi:hypothetical protein